MTPFYADDWLTVYGGDCLDVMRTMPSDSVDCVVTSPPYWGLRDYGNDGQLGLERTPEEYVANMVAVFAEVRRVLKPSGTCWLNLGDSYASSGKNDPTAFERMGAHQHETGQRWSPAGNGDKGRAPTSPGLKPKDLVGIPWRVAFALQADGWYLRSDIIWSKPNPMPESVTDRPTKAHEYLFLLTKSARYYFDADAVREESVISNGGNAYHAGRADGPSYGGPSFYERGTGRNIRSVWTIATRPYPGAHFAVFPPELPERCIKAGSSEKGVCPECGAPWERVVERGKPFDATQYAHRFTKDSTEATGRNDVGGTVDKSNGQEWARWKSANPDVTTGWRRSCACKPCDRDGCVMPLNHDLGAILRLHPATLAPAVVLDPFAGSGTVGMVANRLSRRAILIDLNPEYLKQQMKRNAQTPLGLPA